MLVKWVVLFGEFMRVKRLLRLLHPLPLLLINTLQFLNRLLLMQRNSFSFASIWSPAATRCYISIEVRHAILWECFMGGKKTTITHWDSEYIQIRFVFALHTFLFPIKLHLSQCPFTHTHTYVCMCARVCLSMCMHAVITCHAFLENITLIHSRPNIMV